MSNNNKDPRSIGSLLHRPHLQASHSGSIPADPVLPTRIKATLDEVIAYNNNPRHSKNPMYEEIKESIRNRGLDHAPNVTRRNPSDPYMIKDGGNTRLEILRELWQETGEEKFFHLDLMFYPWTNELDVLIGHMVENEMRGNMIFIERAIAAKKIKKQIETHEGIKLSIRDLAKRITERGWSLDQANLSQMLFAEENLLPAIPDAFWSGIGIDRVKRIRKLLDACRSYWEFVSNPEDGTFNELWKPVFRKLDGDGFDVETAEYQLCGEMAQRLNGPVLSVTAQVQAILEGVKNIELERPSHYQPEPKPPVIVLPKTVQIKSALSQPASAPNENCVPTSRETAVTNIETGIRVEQPQSNISPNTFEPFNFPSDTNPASAAQLDAELGLRKYSLVEIPGGTPLLYGDYTVHTTEHLQMRARDTATAYAKRWGFAHNIIDTVGQAGKQIGYWVSSDGLAQMNEAVRIHWALLSVYSLIRFENRATMLLENIATAFGGEIDTLQTVSMLMAVTHARMLVLGERSRNENQFFNDVWEEIAELEAITSILITRTFEESMKIDDSPDESFVGVERETGEEA